MPELKKVRPLSGSEISMGSIETPQQAVPDSRLKKVGPLPTNLISSEKSKPEVPDESWFKDTAKTLASDFYSSVGSMYTNVGDVVFGYFGSRTEDIEKYTGLPSGKFIRKPAEDFLRKQAAYMSKKGKEFKPKNTSFTQELIGTLGAFPAGGMEYGFGIPYAMIKGYEQGGLSGMVSEGLKRAIVGYGFKAAGDVSKLRGAIGLGFGMGGGAVASGAPRKEVMKETIVNMILGWMGGGRSKLNSANKFLTELAAENMKKGETKAAMEKIDKIAKSQPQETAEILKDSISKGLQKLNKGKMEKEVEKGLKEAHGVTETIKEKIIEKDITGKKAEESADVLLKAETTRERKEGIDKIIETSGKEAKSSAQIFEHPAAQKLARDSWARKVNDAIEAGVLTKKEALDKVKEHNLKLMEIERKGELSKQEKFALQDEIDFGKRYAEWLSKEMEVNDTIETMRLIKKEALNKVKEHNLKMMEIEKKGEISKQEKYTLQDEIDFGKRYAEWLGKEMEAEAVKGKKSEYDNIKETIGDVEAKMLDKIPKEDAVRQVVRDRTENPLIAAEGHLKKGRFDEAIGEAKRAVENGVVLEKADGPITKEMISKAKDRATEIVKQAEEGKGRDVSETFPREVIEEASKRIEKKLPDVEKQLAELEAKTKEVASLKSEGPKIRKVKALPLEKIEKLKEEIKVRKERKREEELTKLVDEQAADIRTGVVDRTKGIDEAIQEGWKTIDSKLNPNTLRSGIDPTILVDVAKLAGLYLKKGGMKFKDWKDEMVANFGSDIKPFLKKAWEMASDVGKVRAKIDKVMEEFGDTTKIVKQRVKVWKGVKYKMVPVTVADVNMVITTNKDLPRKMLGRAYETAIYTFEEMDALNGTKWKEVLHRPYKVALKNAKTEYLDITKTIDVISKGLSRKASKRIGAYAIGQQRGGKATLEANGIKIHKLSEKEMQTYEAMRTVLNNVHFRINAARALSGKEPINKVDNYFTMKRLFDVANSEGFNIMTAKADFLNEAIRSAREYVGKAVKEEIKKPADRYRHPFATPFKWGIKRVKSLRAVDLDSMSVFKSYLYTSLEHIHLSPVIAKGREMINDIKLPDGNLIKLGDLAPRTHIWLEKWLDTIAGKKHGIGFFEAPPALERAMLRLKKNLTFAILSGNVKAILIQPFATVNTVGLIGYKQAYKGGELLLDSKMRDFALKESDVLSTREYMVAVKDAMSFVGSKKLGKIQEKAGSAGLRGLQIFDMQTAVATWLGAYDFAIKRNKGRGHEEAKNFADDIVTKTQGSALKGDIAPIQRTAFGSTITLFQTFNIAQWNLITKELIGKIDMKNPKSFSNAIAWLTAAAIGNIIFDVAGIPSPMPQPIKAFVRGVQDDGFLEGTKEALIEISQLHPLLAGSIRYGSSAFGAPAEFIRDFYVKLSGRKGIQKDWWELISKGMGIPYSGQQRKMIRAYANNGSLYDVLLGLPKEKRSFILESLSK